MPSARLGPRLAPAERNAFSRALPAVTSLTLIVLLAAGNGLAQAEPGVNLTAQSQSVVLEAGSCASFQVTVANRGETADGLPGGIVPPERIDLSLSQPPQDWRADLSDPSVELERGDRTTVTVELCPLENAEGGQRASVLLTAVLEPFAPDPDEREFSDSVTLRAELEEEKLFGIPWELPSWILWAVLGALGVTFAALMMSRRRPAASLVLGCNEPSKEVQAGRGTSFPVRIRNDGRTKDLVSLTTSPVPNGWDTFLPIVDLPLEPGDEQTVWISVKSPDEAREGDHVVVKVFARSSSTAGEQASLDLMVTVRNPLYAPAGSPAGGGGEGARSVYAPEDDNEGAGQSRAVAVRRRKQ